MATTPATILTAELGAVRRAVNVLELRRAVELALMELQGIHQMTRSDIAALAVRASDAAITVGGSPFSWRNTTKRPAEVSVAGGTVTTIEKSYDGSNWRDTGLTAGIFSVPNETYIRVTYAVAPTMRLLQ